MSKKTLAPSNIVTTRHPKGLKFLSIVASAYNSAVLSGKEAQCVNETPGLSHLVENFIAESRGSNRFKDGKVSSSYGYLSGYKPTNIMPQTNRLRELLSGIGSPNRDLFMQIEYGKLELPKGAEGWFAIPNWVKNPIFGRTYAEAVRKVLDMIKQSRSFYSYYREVSIDDNHLRQSSRSVEAWRKISEAQGNPDILLIAGQFGKRHAGLSVHGSLAAMDTSEFGLGAFATGIMLLTHSNRLMYYDDLWISCAGDELAPDSNGVFSQAPYWFASDGKVKFFARYVESSDDRCGTASGFFL